jgi:hypothetical protein
MRVNRIRNLYVSITSRIQGMRNADPISRGARILEV